MRHLSGRETRTKDIRLRYSFLCSLVCLCWAELLEEWNYRVEWEMGRTTTTRRTENVHERGKERLHVERVHFSQNIIISSPPPPPPLRSHYIYYLSTLDNSPGRFVYLSSVRSFHNILCWSDLEPKTTKRFNTEQLSIISVQSRFT